MPLKIRKRLLSNHIVIFRVSSLWICNQQANTTALELFAVLPRFVAIRGFVKASRQPSSTSTILTRGDGVCSVLDPFPIAEWESPMQMRILEQNHISASRVIRLS
jgi:hypothetical protein